MDASATPTPEPPRRGAREAAEPYRPNAVLRWLYDRFFRHIRVDERWSGEVEAAADRGVVVYVMRSISFLDFLCLDYLVKRFRLPLVRFVNDLGLWILEPFGRGERRLRFRRQIPEDRALGEVVSQHHSALLFLRRPPKTLAAPRRRGDELEHDLMLELVRRQRGMERPILLVPQTFVWSKIPAGRRFNLLDLLLGPKDYPGRIRVFFLFIFYYKNALLRSGEAFDLGRFVADNPDLDDKALADKVRYAMLRRIERERTIVLGPTKKDPARMRDELLRSPRVRRAMEAHARSTHRTVEAVEREAERELVKLMADQRSAWLPWINRFLDWVWNRLYDGLVVDEEGIARLREAARRGVLVLLPSHKSHVDYIVLSDVLYRHGISCPLIAAGDNLGFWPLGWMLRRGGAFFIRRSFKGDKLYPTLVDAYMRKLIVEGFNIEFFLEGGRSRTGKLLPPKLGLLSMVVDAALKLQGREIFFVPISIGYERIVEERSYVHELSGGEKQRESISGLLRTPRILRSRYGRLYVQIGETFAFRSLVSAVLRDKPGRPGADPNRLSPVQRRTLVQRIGHGVTYEINRVTVVTPASLLATVLLAHRRRGITRAQLVASAGHVLETLRQAHAKIAPALRGPDGAIREDTLDETVALFGDGRLVAVQGEGDQAIYTVPEERRMALEYYKNNILHFFVPSALISSALLADGRSPVGEHLLRQRVQQLSRLFKYEFMYRVDAEFDEIFDEALARMIASGEVERFADHVRVADDGPNGVRVTLYAHMIRTYFESYRLAVRGARELLLGHTLPRKDWTRRTLTLGQRLYLSGEIELRESVSRSRLESAVSALKDHGLVQITGGDGLSSATDADAAAFEEVEERLGSFLR